MIGILDSGSGGLCVARRIVEQFPDCDIVYFGDTARMPYGDKSADTIIRYAFENSELLLAKGAKMIVIASHTVSCVAGRHIRKALHVPVLDVMIPTINLALKATPNFAIGVMASQAAVDCNGYPAAILTTKPAARVYSVACPLLVALVEAGWLKKPETVRIVKKYVHPLKVRQIDTLILGSNHYTLLKPTIQRKIGKRVNIVDATDAIIPALHDFIQQNKALDQTLSRQGKRQFLVSDLNEHAIQTAKRFFKGNISLAVRDKK